RPARATFPRKLDAIGGAIIHGVAPRDDSVGRKVLPLRAELLELPVGPCLAAVCRQTPPIPHRAVPDFPVGTEPEGMDEIEGNRPRGRVVRMLDLLPAPGPSAQHEDALPIGPDPDGVVGRASQCEHVHAEAGGVGERGEGLGAGESRCDEEDQNRQECGMRNAECGMAVLGSTRALTIYARSTIPHSAFRIPHFVQPRSEYTVGSRRISVTSTRGARVTANSTASATSPACSMASRLVNPGRPSGSIGSQIGVSTGPGETMVVRTPVRDNSARSTSCIPRRPNLLAAYAVEPVKATWSAMEPMVTK